MASEQELKDMISSISNQRFNYEVELIPIKIEEELHGLPEEEKIQKIQGLLALHYSRAALKASTDTLAEVLIKLGVLDK